MKTVIIYSSRHGFTEKAAEKLSERLTSLVDLKNLDTNFERDFSEYHNIIFGTPVYEGKIRNLTAKYIEENLEELCKKNLGLFICASENTPVEKIINSNLPKNFCEQLKVKGHFGYGVDFEKLNRRERVASKIILKKTESEMAFNEKNIIEFAEIVNQIDFVRR
ncbi:MAG TPA: flavodoxin domain-containing protein [Thermotogota bacterium]|nr:flavodoxin domain-containing protein [Thermotogota bacterium]